MVSEVTTARVARGATYVFVQGFANAVFGLLYFVILARNLTQEVMGVFALMFFILSLPQIFGLFALPSAAVKYIPQYLAEGNEAKARGVVKRVLQISLIACVISFFVLFVPAEFLSLQLFGKPDYVIHFRLLAVSSVFNILYVAVSGFLQGLRKISEYAALSLAYMLIQNSVGMLLVSLGWGLYGVVSSWLVGLSIAAIAGLVLTLRKIKISGKPHELKPLFKFSLPLYFSGVVGYFMGWADQLMLVSYMSLLYGASQAQEILGVYYVAIRAAAVPTIFSTAIVTATFPHLSALYAKEGSNSLKDAFHLSSRYAVLIGFPLIVGIATLAYPTILLFAGTSYVDATMPLIIISIGTLVGTLGVTIGPILLTLERTMIASVLNVISVALSIVLSFIALAMFGLGMIGTAWARTFASIISLLMLLYILNRYVKIAFDKEALWKSAIASIFLVVSIISTDLLRGLISPQSYQFLAFRLQLLPVYVIIGGLAYFLALVVLKAFKKSDLSLLEEYLPKRFRWLVALLQRIARIEQ